jgi:UTP-glucose-1-phosphate uridylyltransferase
MERVSEAVASGMGTVAFLIVSSKVIVSDLLQRNTDLAQQIHVLAEKLNTLTEEVHRATCMGGKPTP